MTISKLFSTEQIRQDPAKGIPSVVGVGNFDGLHIGHTTLIGAVVAASRVRRLTPAVLTFETHPRSIEAGRTGVWQLVGDETRNRLLEEMGVERLLLMPFDKQVSRLSPQDFVREVLLPIGCKIVYCGHNFRFGYKAQGDPEALTRIGRGQGIETVVIPLVELDGEPVSSTRIRELIRQGDMMRVARLLGRRYSIKVLVEPGQKLGRTIGLPTINQKFYDHMIVPESGVYATRALIGGEWLDSVTNIGMRPTVGGTFVNAETHILNFSADLYGQKIEVEFWGKIRGEKKFPDLEALRTQIQLDIAAARAILQGTDMESQ